jgi:hypothetical protein
MTGAGAAGRSSKKRQDQETTFFLHLPTAPAPILSCSSTAARLSFRAPACCSCSCSLLAAQERNTAAEVRH